MLLTIADTLKGITNAADPIYTGGALTIHTDAPIGVMFVSCAHLGGRYTVHRQFWTLIKQALALPNLYFAFLGDDTEGFLPTFKDRSAPMSQPLSIAVQLTLLALIVKHLAGARRLLFGMAGQHSGDWYTRNFGYNPVERAYRDQGVPYFDGQAYFVMTVGQQEYRLAVSHQFPGHSMYNKLHAQTRAFHWNFPSADVVAMGDKHTYAMQEEVAYTWEFDAGLRSSPYVWFVQTGTAKVGPDKYTLKRYPRGQFDWPMMVFDNLEHRIIGMRDLEVARAWFGRTRGRVNA